MRITFKDVGQGDSIILEWNDGSGKVAIIDCRKVGQANPTLTHIIDSGYAEIEFILISHPHLDHYSGVLELLEYSESSGIRINQFLSTMQNLQETYWNWFEPDDESSILLRRIIDKANDLYERGIIGDLGYINNTSRIDLTDSMYLNCLAPAHAEMRRFQQLVDLRPQDNPKACSRAANYLSTVFKLSLGNEHFALLTSDGEKVVFNRLLNRDPSFHGTRKLVLGQVPHHGSRNNHHADFWRNIDKIESPSAVVSVGEHHSYHHPDVDVLRFFHDSGYNVTATNHVNGMEELLIELTRSTLVLDTGSDIFEEYKAEGDQCFDFSTYL